MSILCAVLSCGFGASVEAEVRAVLVGVSEYRVLDADLKGPVADVGLMAEVLTARGVTPAQIVTLATGGTEPDRAGILAALGTVAAQSVAGDTVMFYFSGHGGQAPDQSGDEGGGWDEILLPSDAAGWKGSIGSVENAILDDELQAWAQGLLSRGVQVVGVIDACHSDTGFRAAGGVGVPRGLGARALGIPQTAIPQTAIPDAAVPAAAVPETGAVGQGLSGAFVFLYSSQSDQRSFEVPVGADGLWHGAFTMALARALRTAPDAAWAQILAATSAAMLQGAVPQHPDGEGPLLRAAVFGHTAPQRFAVADGMVQAGLLHGLAEGSEVAFHASADDANVLAVAVLDKVAAREARVQGAVPGGALWAEVTGPPPVAPMRLGGVVLADAGDYAEWQAILQPGLAPGDFVPVLTGGQLALVGADGVLDPFGPGSSPRVVPAQGETHAQALARTLEAIGRALRLRQLLIGVAGRSLTGHPALDVRWQRAPAAPLGAGCGVAAAGIPFDPVAGLRACDQLWVSFRNVSGQDLDVSVLYFGADFTVSGIWPRQGLSNRMAPGESARAGMQIDRGSVGMDEVMLLAVPVQPGTARVDLTRLAEPSLIRGFAGGAVEAWLDGKMRGEMMPRGFSKTPAAVMMIRQPVRVRSQD